MKLFISHSFPRVNLGAKHSLVTDISFHSCAKEMLQTKFNLKKGKLGSSTNSKFFETSRKKIPAPNVGLEPTTLRLRVSFLAFEMSLFTINY